MAQKNYIGRIRLTNFIGSQIIEREDEDGVMVKGVFIPMDKNDLREYGKGCVDAVFYISESTIATVCNWSHYFHLKASKAFIEMMKSHGYKHLPYIGNMKPSGYFNKYKSKKDPQRVKMTEYE